MLLCISLKHGLLLWMTCHVVEQIEAEKKEHRLHYIMGDWQPHFGYHPAHLSSVHGTRSKRLNENKAEMLSSLENPDTTALDRHVVRLQRQKRFICSGIWTGVHDVLTTRLCLVDVPLTEVQVTLFDGSTHNVVGNRSAHEYATDTGEELLQILQLEKGLENTFTGPPPICNDIVTFADKVELWSWNRANWQLKKKPARQIPAEECKQLINDTDGKIITAQFNCLENNHGGSRCEKNYGLPYVWRGQFCGINIMGHNCVGVTKADVYRKLMNVKLFMAMKASELQIAKLHRAMP